VPFPPSGKTPRTQVGEALIRHNGCMTTPSPFSGRRPADPVLPKGNEVARYDTYAEAQQAVDQLVKRDFAVQDVSIVGNDLKSVEHVTGRLTWGRAAGAGALSGLYFGVLIGIVLVLFSPGSPNVGGVAVAAALLGAGSGMLLGLTSYALTRRIRDFTSTRAVVASSYSLVVNPESSGRAGTLLGVTPGSTPATAPAPTTIEDLPGNTPPAF